MTGKYRINIVCGNCGSTQGVDIPKGELALVWLDENKPLCDVCGCKNRDERYSGISSIFIPVTDEDVL